MHRRSLASSILRHRRGISAALVVTGALAVGLPAPAGADLRVSRNYPLRPTSQVLYGRDAVGFAVNPRNARHIVALYADWINLTCETAMSTDGGLTWQRRNRLRAPAGYAVPPCTVGDHLAQQVDGGIAFGAGNNVYATFATGIVDQSGVTPGQALLVARSTNGGRSFGTADVVLPGGEDGEQGPDYSLPKLAVSPGGSAGSDRVHISALSSGKADGKDAVFVASTDSGRTWTPRRVANAPETESAIEPTEPVIGRNGAVYVGYRTQNPDPAKPGSFLPTGTVEVAKTTDLGASWTRTTVAGVSGFVYGGPRVAPFTTRTTFTASTFPRLAADRRTDDVYVVYGNGGTPTVPGTAAAADHFIHPDSDVWFQRSRDGGATWSLPDRVNKQAPIQYEITQTRHPTLNVAPTGRVDVVWQDRRHWYRACTQTHVPCDEARLGDTYLRSSLNRGRSFLAERRITDRSMNNDVGFDYRFGAYWDYGPRAVSLGDDRLLVGWMDSRAGNSETDTMGIYLAKVDLKASHRVPVQRVPRASAADLAVSLSRLAYPGGNESTLAGTFATKPTTRVVIVNERDFAGALAGGVLARANLGPVLLTSSGGLSGSVKAELARLGPVGAYVIGDTASLSDQVIADLVAGGVPQDQITRIAGATPADTAAQIALAMDRRSDPDRAPDNAAAATRAFDAAVVVNPASPDAGAAAILAANRRLPVLFAGGDAAPAATTAALAQLAIPDTIVVGSNRWIGDAALRGMPRPQRLAGRDAVATSRLLIAQSRRRGLPSNIVYTARASRKMDAALLGFAGGRTTGLLLLTHRGESEIPFLLNSLRIRGSVDRVIAVDDPAPRGR